MLQLETVPSSNKYIYTINLPEEIAPSIKVMKRKVSILNNFTKRIGDIHDSKLATSSANQVQKTSRFYFWSGGAGIIFALLSSCFIFCAWPQHHIYIVPTAWYEFMTTAAIGFIGLFSASLILNCEIWLDVKDIKTWKNLIVLYLGSVVAWIMVNIGYYHIYSVMLNLRPPMPLNIHVCGTLTLALAMSFFWMLIPQPIRRTNMFWKRYAYYALSQIIRYLVILEYTFLTWLFVMVDKTYQWPIAILLPVLREINARIFTEVCYRSAGFQSTDIKITAVHEMACRHAVFLCVALSLIVKESTAFLFIGFDFVVNLSLCLRIIWRTKKRKQIITVEEDSDLQELALNEKTVYVVPLAYFICLTVAYFGPNTGIIGNVGNSSWHFGIVEDLVSPMLIMFVMFLVDIVAVIIWALLLKTVCNVSYFQSYIYLQKKFWLIMAIHEGYSLNEVSQNLNCIIIRA